MQKYQIKFEENSLSSTNIRHFMIPDSVIYLATGQYLGIGFGETDCPSYLCEGTDSYYIDLNSANNALETGRPIMFIRQSNRVILGFTIRSSPSL
ncbi:unnamed protein product [Rotaria sp. Silwood1]|nr:unnamed protein product [Rotaria sp. Silwood1]CAF1676633.1 unnamed protein product [Rotaria sp. Silwood1]